MKLFEQIFGLVIGLFGIIFDVTDIISFEQLINAKPLPSHLFEINTAITFVFVLGTLMIFGGFYIFMQSRKKIY
jgi:hypothetical protein